MVFKGKNWVILWNRQKEVRNESNCDLSKVSLFRWSGKIAVIPFQKEMVSGSAGITMKWNRSVCTSGSSFHKKIKALDTDR